MQLIKESSKRNVYSRNIIEVINNCIDFPDADVTRKYLILGICTFLQKFTKEHTLSFDLLIIDPALYCRKISNRLKLCIAVKK